MAGKVKSIKITKRYSGFIYIFAFSFLVILFGCVQQPRPNFSDDISPEQKKVELKRSLDRRYNDPPTHFLLAQLYHAEGAWDDAEFYYNNALRFDPVYRPAQAGLVKLFIDRGDTLKAQHYYENYMNQVGDNPSKIVELAREFQVQGLDSYAMKCFNEALSIAPKSAEVHKYLGYFYLSRNDKDKAREHFEESFNTDNTQEDIARELGKLGVPIIYEGIPPESEQNL